MVSVNGKRFGCSVLLLALFCSVSGLVYGFEDEDHYGPQPTGAEQASVWTAEMQAEHADDEDILVLPGVVANRKAQAVQVLAEATGLPPGDTPEFVLIDIGSSHGYEAIFWSMAKPSDVHRALEFIGLEPGGAVNPAALRFWAQGDPVRVLLEMPGGERIPIEETIFDIETGAALEEEGFIFTGSLPVTLPDTGNQQHYAADVYDPRAILPLFNDPGAALDIPRQAHQGEVYGRYAANPDWPFDHGQMLTVVMQPAITDAAARREFRLQVATTNATEDLVFSLFKPKVDAALMVSPELTPVLENVVAGDDEHRVPILTLDFQTDIPIGGLGRLSRIVALMESFNQVRIAPPGEGQLYYRAFVPAPQWRTPEGRPTQPWELHLDVEDGAVSAQLVLHEPRETEEGEADDPAFDRVTHTLEGPADILRVLITDAAMREAEQRLQPPAVLLVFADPTLAYGTLLQYLAPVRETHGTMYIFTEAEEKQ